MARKEIEQTVEVTEHETLTEEIVFCDGCGGECTDDYVTLSNLGPECTSRLMGAIDAAKMMEPHVAGQRDWSRYQEIAVNAEYYDFCPGCQTGIRENQAIPAGLYAETDTDTDLVTMADGVKLLTILSWTMIPLTVAMIAVDPLGALIWAILAFGLWWKSALARRELGMEFNIGSMYRDYIDPEY